LESQNDECLEEATRDAFERACTVHHPDKPSLHLMWSTFEELHGNFDKAAEILLNIDQTNPNLLQVAYRRINIERRRKDFDKCVQLYELYINQAKNKNISSSLAIKYARFMHKLKGDIEYGLNILKSALENDPSNARLVLQMIDLALQRTEVNEVEIVNIIDNFIARENMEPDQKVLFAQRKVEFLEDFGSTAKGLQEAQRTLQVALSKANEAKKKQSESASSKKTAKETSNPPLPQSGSTPSNFSSSSYNYASNPNSSSYYYGNSQPAAGYQSYGDYGTNSWGQYSQSGYSGYQWSGYGNYY
jgi:pre-mRNA-processing factor 39